MKGSLFVTERDREVEQKILKECSSKPVVRVNSAYLSKPGAVWRTVDLCAQAREERLSQHSVREKAAAKEARALKPHAPEPIDPVTKMRMWYVRQAQKVTEQALAKELTRGAMLRTTFLIRFGLHPHTLVALARLGKVVLLRGYGKSPKTGRPGCVGFVGLPSVEYPDLKAHAHRKQSA